MTASPDVGSTFAEWSGECSGTAASCTVTMDAAKNVSATFTANPVIPPATNAAVAAAIAGGQQYLFSHFSSIDGTKGRWPNSIHSDLAPTCLAVMALIETGKYSDPNYAPLIDKGINYIKTKVQGNGGIYSNLNNATYETGLSLIALTLYGSVNPQNAAYNTIIQNAYNSCLKNGQNTNGGWGHYANEETWDDLYHTHFAVMGRSAPPRRSTSSKRSRG